MHNRINICCTYALRTRSIRFASNVPTTGKVIIKSTSFTRSNGAAAEAAEAAEAADDDDDMQDDDDGADDDLGDGNEKDKEGQEEEDVGDILTTAAADAML